MLFRYFKAKHLKELYRYYVYPMFSNSNRKGFLTQLAEMIWLSREIKYWPHNYFKFKGYEKGRDVKDLVPYLPGRLFDTLREDILNRSKNLRQVTDKFLFNQVLRSSNIPCTKVHGKHLRHKGFFDAAGQAVSQGTFLGRLSEDFVMKPTLETGQGSGVTVVQVKNSGVKKFLFSGKELSSEEFKICLEHDAHYAFKETLIEKRLEQHPFLSQIYPDSINTVRIDTLRRLDGEVLTMGCFLRMGKGGRQVDNWHGFKGGIAVGINIENGRLKKVGYDYSLNEYETHPDSGFYFENAELPRWSEIIKTVKKAASLFPGVNSIGWDVASGTEHPIIIEGNADYALQSIQITSGPYFKKKDFVRAVHQHIQESKYRRRYEKYFTRWV